MTLVADINDAFTVDAADATLTAGGIKIAGVDDDDSDIDRDAAAGNNNGTVRDAGDDASDGTGTPVKTVLPDGCVLGDDNDGVTAPGADAYFP